MGQLVHTHSYKMEYAGRIAMAHMAELLLSTEVVTGTVDY